MIHVSVAVDLSVRARILGYSGDALLSAAREVTKRELRAIDDMNTPEAEAVAKELAYRIGRKREKATNA